MRHTDEINEQLPTTGETLLDLFHDCCALFGIGSFITMMWVGLPSVSAWIHG